MLSSNFAFEAVHLSQLEQNCFIKLKDHTLELPFFCRILKKNCKTFSAARAIRTEVLGYTYFAYLAFFGKIYTGGCFDLQTDLFSKKTASSGQENSTIHEENASQVRNLTTLYLCSPIL